MPPCLAPPAPQLVIFGVDDRPRSSYAIWEEKGKTPDWVLEVTSKKTWEKDEEEKPETYSQMGVSEYFQYDPSGQSLRSNSKFKIRLGKFGGKKIYTPDFPQNSRFSPHI